MTRPSASAGPGAAPPSGAAAAADRALVLLAIRLEAVLGEELAHISRGDFAALENLIERKSMLALDLDRLASQFCSNLSECARRTLHDIRSQIENNAVLLREHIDAVGEISRIIADTLQSETSDGTYSSSAARGRI